VRVDDPVVELERDKVAVEIAATSAGVMSEILVEEGTEVAPGTVLGRISAGAGASTDKATAQGAGLAPKTDRDTRQIHIRRRRSCRPVSAAC